MTETERMDAADRALIAKCEEELNRLAGSLRALLAARRLARKDARSRREYAVMEQDFGDRKGAARQRIYRATALADLYALKARILTAIVEYRMTFSDITRARKDIGRRHTPEYDRPKWFLGSSVFSSRQIIEGDRP